MSPTRPIPVLTPPGPSSTVTAPSASGAFERHPFQRNVAVDFTKGVLVLFMVLYHSVNYMVGAGVDLKYLAFLPPSFILITGFLIGKVYLAKYESARFAAQKRLVVRGLKLLLMFTLLNLGVALLLAKNYNNRSFGIDSFLDNVAGIYVTGNGRQAIFEILVPISYLLIIGAPLLSLCRLGQWFLPILCASTFALIGILDFNHISFENLNLVAVGFLGMLFSQIPDRCLNAAGRFLFLIIAAYVAYLGAIASGSRIYWLQLAGVCLSVALIYLLAQKIGDTFVSRRVIRLGQYSLLAYILQIAVLQVLIRLWRIAGVERGKFVLSLALTSATIIVAVETLRVLREKSKATDLCYRAAFG